MIHATPRQPTPLPRPEIDELANELIVSCCRALAANDGHAVTDRVLHRYWDAGKAAAAAMLAVLAGSPGGSDVAHLPRIGIMRMRQLAGAVQAWDR